MIGVGRLTARGESRAPSLMKHAMIPLLAAPSPAIAQDAWTHLGRGPDRTALVTLADVPDLSRTRWTSADDASGAPIAFVGQAGVVTDGAVVLALGSTALGGDRLFAFHAWTGRALWSAAVPAPVFDSWASPAIDAPNDAALVASGDRLVAVDLADGQERWSTRIGDLIVNASPVVTDDLGPRDRAFITDYTFSSGAEGRLWCVNVDPFDAGTNPYQPGEIVWSVPLGGQTSGNTPAYHAGAVYVTVSSNANGAGAIHAFDATATQTPAPLWTAGSGPAGLGFFGGCAVDPTGSGAVYAATYGFGPAQFGSNAVRVDAASGALAWSVPTNRTDSIPIGLRDGRMVLSTGIDGFGSLPSVQLLRDDPANAGVLWDSTLDGGPEHLGGWTHQPAAILVGDARWLLVGTPPEASADLFAPHDGLRLVDLSRAPDEPGFVADAFEGAGGSPALARGTVYAVGPIGLVALGTCPADVTGDGARDFFDVSAFLAHFDAEDRVADLDGNGAHDFFDVSAYLALLQGGCP